MRRFCDQTDVKNDFDSPQISCESRIVDSGQTSLVDRCNGRLKMFYKRDKCETSVQNSQNKFVKI
jgi:hypothetical protein